MFFRIASICFLGSLAFCKNLDDLRRQADHARKIEDPATAAALYGKALQLDSNWLEGWWYLGNMQYKLGQYKLAVEATRHLTLLRPEMAEGWGLLGLAAMGNKSYDEALRCMNKSLGLSFRFEPGLRNVVITSRALVLVRLGQFEEALRVYREFVRSGPDPILIDALGVAALRRKWLPAEIPEDQKPLIARAGQVEFAALRDDPASQHLAEMLENDFPNTPSVHYMIGLIAFSVDVPRAEEEFRQELAVSGGTKAAAAMLAYSSITKGGDLAAANQLAIRALSADDKNAFSLYVVARDLDAQGNHLKAISKLKEAIDTDPENIEYHVALVAAYEAEGDAQEAVAERRRALELKFSYAE